jgi:hypothetical protein
MTLDINWRINHMIKINLMPKPVKVDGLILKGRIVFEYLEAPDKSWILKVKPTYLPDPQDDIRSVYKMGLLTADCKAHTTRMLETIDKVLLERREMEKVHNEIVQAKIDQKKADKEKALADVDKYQQELPFTEGDIL